MKRAIYLFLLSCCCSTISGFTQNRDVQDTLFLKIHLAEEGAKIRWAPANKYLWSDGLTHGYRLTRKTIMRKGELLDTPEIIVLKEKILPAPEEAWIKQMPEDPMAAVVAQTIYGERMEISGGSQGNSITRTILETDELNKRYSFAVYACDRSFAAAGLAGLAYTDRSLHPDEIYIYEVRLLNPDPSWTIEGVSFIRASEPTVLPVVQAPVAIAKDSTVHLTWNFNELAYSYTAYQIERSTDGVAFRSLHDTPITALSPDALGNITFTDVPGEYGTYWYRLRGVDVFGESGPVSKACKVTVKPPFTTRAKITRSETLPDGTITLHWEIGKLGGTPVKAYDLYASTHPGGTFAPLQTDINKGALSTQVTQKSAVAYYKVYTKDYYQRSLESPAFMVQIPDTIPPHKPFGLKGVVNEENTIYLSWDTPGDPDLLGYDIYMAPSRGASFSRLNTKPVIGQEFSYPLKDRGSLEYVRFMVRAIDERYNESFPSDTVIIRHYLPPVAPVIRHYQYRRETGLELHWSANAQIPQTMVRIYRQDNILAMDEQWTLLTEIPAGDKAGYTDKEVYPGKTYRYILTSVSAKGGESNPSDPITLKVPGIVEAVKSSRMHLMANREFRGVQIHWRCEGEGLVEVRLYRRLGTGKFSLYRTFQPDRKSFTDTDVMPNNEYSYLLIGLNTAGGMQTLGEENITF